MSAVGYYFTVADVLIHFIHWNGSNGEGLSSG